MAIILIASFLICTNTFDDIARKALKSCIEQNTSYKFEIILVVNGPQHVEMSEIISEFFGNEITIFNSDKEGLVENLNLGLRECTGEYILRFDADDICNVERLQSQIEFMQNNPQVDVSFGDAKVIDAEGYAIGRYLAANPNSYWFLVFRNYVNHPTVCVKRAALLEAGGYKNKFACEDYDLWLRLKFLHNKKFGYIGKELIEYRNFSTNGFRRNSSAYFNMAKSKFRVGLVTQTYRLFFGVIFSIMLGLFYWILSKVRELSTK